MILLQSDEGPFPADYADDEWGFEWQDATDAELEEKFGILFAMRVPGADLEAEGFHDAITPVNAFRIVFNARFGTDLPLLPDRTVGAHRQLSLLRLVRDHGPPVPLTCRQAVASTARSASAIGRPPLDVMPSWKARSASVSEAPRFAKNASRMRTISRQPVRYDEAWVGQAQ